MKSRKKYILAEIEATYGVDPTPTTADAILTSGLQRVIYGGPTVSRDFDRSTLGASSVINTAPTASITFQVELAGSSALGTAPPYSKILRAVGWAETVNASTDVEYDPVSAGYEAVAVYYDNDGERQKFLGSRGTGGLSMAVGAIPKLNFTLTGFYATPTASSLVTPDVSAFQAPVPVNKANTGTCTIGAYDLIMQSLDIDFGNTVNHFNYVNYEEVLISDRSMSGSMTVLAPLISTKDMYALVESHAGVTTSAFNLVHGTSTNAVTLDAPAMQLTTMQEVDIDGERGFQLSFILSPSSGDDELKITIGA